MRIEMGGTNFFTVLFAGDQVIIANDVDDRVD